jgi:hypothetical protein
VDPNVLSLFQGAKANEVRPLGANLPTCQNSAMYQGPSLVCRIERHGDAADRKHSKGETLKDCSYEVSRKFSMQPPLPCGLFSATPTVNACLAYLTDILASSLVDEIKGAL